MIAASRSDESFLRPTEMPIDDWPKQADGIAMSGKRGKKTKTLDTGEVLIDVSPVPRQWRRHSSKWAEEGHVREPI